MQVVCDDKDAAVSGQCPEQCRRGNLDRDRIDGGRRLDPKRVAQRPRLGSGNTIDVIEHRVQQVAEGGVRQVGFPLVTAGVQRRGFGRREQLVEQGGLADP
ncbi:MAG: hypothetical protein ABL982_20350 [Vicinamibacterales bacterium]